MARAVKREARAATIEDVVKAVGEIDLMPGGTVGDLRRAYVARIRALGAAPPLPEGGEG
jgi:hypothetical protein